MGGFRRICRRRSSPAISSPPSWQKTWKPARLEFYSGACAEYCPIAVPARGAGGDGVLPVSVAEGLCPRCFRRIAFVSNLYLMEATGGYFGENAYFQPLMHTWSLAVEEQFYIVFPSLAAVASQAWPCSSRDRFCGQCFRCPRRRDLFPSAWAGSRCRPVAPSKPIGRCGTVGLVLIAGRRGL